MHLWHEHSPHVSALSQFFGGGGGGGDAAGGGDLAGGGDFCPTGGGGYGDADGGGDGYGGGDGDSSSEKVHFADGSAVQPVTPLQRHVHVVASVPTG